MVPACDKDYAIGYLHIDIAELRYEGGKGFLYGAVDRTSKLVSARICRKATKLAAAAFLKSLVRAVPCRIHTVLTDNGVQFTQLPRGQSRGWLVHIFARVSLENGIEHRLTKVCHPWTNGQVERMNRTIKDATVKRYYYQSHDQLKSHLQTFLMAYNFARRLKTLKGLTPYEYIYKIWTTEPQRFTIDPSQHTVGLNN